MSREILSRMKDERGELIKHHFIPYINQVGFNQRLS